MFAHMLLTVALLGADDPKANTLEGTYITLRGENSGKEFPADHFKDTSVVIHDGTIVVYCARTGEQMNFDYRLVKDAHGLGIDMKATLGPDEGKTFLGIYQAQEDRLRISYFSAGGSQRPRTFEAAEGTGQLTFEMKKVAP